MTHIHFIVNSVAANRRAPLNETFLRQYFVENVHHLTIKQTAYKKHAMILTRESIAENADIIVACGGDGTINEVASCLVGTTIPLGIIPIGSGNGLASNLGIPKNLRKALRIIRNQQAVRIDVGQINNRYFFSNMGVGFDARVIKYYESSQRHTLYGYIWACLASIREFKTIGELNIQVNNTMNLRQPFIILISNSNELGYNLSLTPKASLQDGLLDVFIVSKIGPLKMLWLGILMLMKKEYWLKEAKSFQTSEIQLSNSELNYFESQIDGELHNFENKSLHICVLEKSLNVLVSSTL